MLRSDSEKENIDLTLRLGPPVRDEESQNALKEQEKYKEYLLQKRLRYRRAKEALIAKGLEAVEDAKVKKQKDWQKYKLKLASDPKKNAIRREKVRKYSQDSYLRMKNDSQRYTESSSNTHSIDPMTQEELKLKRAYNRASMQRYVERKISDPKTKEDYLTRRNNNTRRYYHRIVQDDNKREILRLKQKFYRESRKVDKKAKPPQ